MPNEEDFLEYRVLNPAKAAVVLDTCEATLARWRGQGIGPRWFKPPGSNAIRYKLRDLSAWLESGARIKTSDEPPEQRGGRYSHLSADAPWRLKPRQSKAAATAS